MNVCLNALSVVVPADDNCSLGRWAEIRAASGVRVFGARHCEGARETVASGNNICNHLSK